jgi:hypothetical protein
MTISLGNIRVQLFHLGLFFLGFWHTINTSAIAEEYSAIYYLSVGSEHFARIKNNVWNLQDIGAAARGARRVANLLDQHNAKFGIVLTSDLRKTSTLYNDYSSQRYVSKADVYIAMSKVIEEVKYDKENPLIVIYLSSHGFAKGSAWGHYTVPGDVVFTSNPLRLPRRFVHDRLIPAADIFRILKASNRPFILILDSCYENDSAWQKQVYKVERERFSSVSAWDKLIQEQRQNERLSSSYPVVFAAPVGDRAFLAPDPRDKSFTTSIPPLARRLTLLFDAAENEREEITLNQVVDGLTSKKSDSLTSPGISFWTGTSFSMLPNGAAPSFRVIEEVGTGSQPLLCCSLRDMR